MDRPTTCSYSPCGVAELWLMPRAHRVCLRPRLQLRSSLHVTSCAAAVCRADASRTLAAQVMAQNALNGIMSPSAAAIFPGESGAPTIERTVKSPRVTHALTRRWNMYLRAL